MFKFSGKRPRNLGLQTGRLRPCPDTPNCVCSVRNENNEDASSSSGQFIQPFRFSGSVDNALDQLERVLSNISGATIVTRSNDYLHAEVASGFFGFVDDLEFHLIPSDGIVHVRSAARVGYADFGVNRARLEQIRNAFETG